MKEYVLKRQNTFTEYIALQHILELYEETMRVPGKWVAKRWWDQEVPDLAGSRAAASEAAEIKEGGRNRRKEKRSK